MTREMLSNEVRMTLCYKNLLSILGQVAMDGEREKEKIFIIY